MDFSWTTEQIELYQDLQTFGQDVLNEQIVQRDESGHFSQENWQKCADKGILGLAVPRQFGGQEKDLMTTMYGMEGLGYGCKENALTLGLNAQMWTVQLPIQHFGTEEQKERFLPDLIKGKSIGAQAITEETAGSDAFALKMTAEKQEDGYLLNGEKRYITFGPIADVVMVLATTNADKGIWGVTAFLVEKGREGFEGGPVENKMGLKTLPMGNLAFRNCKIPLENRLGSEGGGLALSNFSLGWERSCMLASFVGSMQRQVEIAVNFARKRQQFGQPIGKFQSVANRIVDMKVKLETARLLIYKVAWLKSQDKPATMEAAMAKLYLTECFLESSESAIRIHGAKGYLQEHGIERDLRDAIGGVLYGGTSDIQRNIIARLLGL